MTQTIKGLMKTHNCTELTNQDVGSTVKLCGWVNKKRDLGGLNFIDLRSNYFSRVLNSCINGNEL